MSPGSQQHLRHLLDEARQEADLLGHDPREEPDGIGYFEDPDGHVQDAIGNIAAHSGPVALFVGAGVSMEAGLPSWTELLVSLLRELAHDLAADEDKDQWLDAVLREGPLAAGAIARALHPDDASFRRALRTALYGGQKPSDYAPGALAGQIAWLKQRLGPRLALLTANFDGLLEAALREAGQDPISYVRAWAEPAGKSAVWHLHGRLMQNASGSGWLTDGNIVLAEGDYVQTTYGTWPQAHVAEHLRESLCVFVGLSMTDPNFIRWLYRHGAGAPREHIVVFVRQGGPAYSDEVRRKQEESAAARWTRYGVRPIWTNYYGEVAQVIHEIGLQAAGGAHVPFLDRADQRLDAGKRLLAPDNPAEFPEAQLDAAAWLAARVEGIRSIADNAGVDLADEDLGLGIWGVDHRTGIAELWATSDRALRRRDAIEKRSLHVGSRWVAVEALTRGVPVEQDPAVYTTRWRFVRGIPIVVEPLAERSVVGALTLTSATVLDDCPLSVANAPAGLLHEIDRFLGDAASELFT